MASLNITFETPSGTVTYTRARDLTGYVQIPNFSFALLLALIAILIRLQRFRADNLNASLKPTYIQNVLKKTPWKWGIPLLSELEFFNDNEIFLREGFQTLGDTFAFRFLKAIYFLLD